MIRCVCLISLANTIHSIDGSLDTVVNICWVLSAKQDYATCLQFLIWFSQQPSEVSLFGGGISLHSGTWGEFWILLCLFGFFICSHFPSWSGFLALTLPPPGKLRIFACLLGFAGDLLPVLSRRLAEIFMEEGSLAGWITWLSGGVVSRVKSGITPTLPSTESSDSCELDGAIDNSTDLPYNLFAWSKKTWLICSQPRSSVAVVLALWVPPQPPTHQTKGLSTCENWPIPSAAA